jgi:hypothetical protein
MTQDDDDYAVISAMLIFGGSFAEAMAKAWQRGDAVNRARVKAAFPDLFTKYAEMARQHQTPMIKA